MLELFLSFARVGLFTVGGGYAMIAIIEDLCVSEKKWISQEEMMELIVVAESTPGPIAINCASYVGYRQKGMAGAVAATLGMVLPSLVVILGISMFLDNFLEIRWIASAFRGIKVGAGVVIIHAGLNMMKKTPKDRLSRLLLWFGLGAMLLGDLLAWNISSIAVMLTAGLVSLGVFLGREAGK